MKNCIVAQSGGPTAAINASLAGVIRSVMSSDQYDHIYGALHGIQGVFDEQFLTLDQMFQDDCMLKELSKTPAMYLGSCRYKLPSPESDPFPYERLFQIFDRMNIGAFFYIGGNDSMDTVAKLSRYADSISSRIRFAGVPKTIDNDLVNTDHTPGFGSAAKYIAASMLEIAHDTYIYQLPAVTIVEIMGRDAGWLTASAALARNDYNPAPQLIYLPETAFSTEQFLADLTRELKKSNNIVVAVSEGIRDKDGNYISASTLSTDKFGHAQLSGAGKALEILVKENLGIKCRSIELNILQRCASHIVSMTDLAESEALGAEAVKLTEMGHTGFMTALKRDNESPYHCSVIEGDLQSIANAIRSVPREWINASGNDVTDDMLRYLTPLIQGEPETIYRNGLPVFLPIDHLTKER